MKAKTQKRFTILAICICFVLLCLSACANDPTVEENGESLPAEPGVIDIYDYSEPGFQPMHLEPIVSEDHILRFQAITQEDYEVLAAYFRNGFDGAYETSDFRDTDYGGYYRIQNLGNRIWEEAGGDEAAYSQSVRDFTLVSRGNSVDLSKYNAFPNSAAVQDVFEEVVRYTMDSVLFNDRRSLEGSYIENAAYGDNPIFGFTYDVVSTCRINLIGGDLGSLGPETDDFLEIMREIYNGDNASEIDGERLAMACFSQRREWLEEAVAEHAPETCHHYLTYTVLDGTEYLLQFSSEYSAANTVDPDLSEPGLKQLWYLDEYVEYLVGLCKAV